MAVNQTTQLLIPVGGVCLAVAAAAPGGSLAAMSALAGAGSLLLPELIVRLSAQALKRRPPREAVRHVVRLRLWQLPMGVACLAASLGVLGDGLVAVPFVAAVLSQALIVPLAQALAGLLDDRRRD